jgi:DNA-binding response OmpR family regulator
MSRVIVVEGRVRPRVALLLGESGIGVERVSVPMNQVAGLVSGADPDVLVLEVVVISTAVLHACEAVTGISRVHPVVFGEHATELEIVAAYTAGAQAVLVEPVGPHELVARVRAVMRRIPVTASPIVDVIKVGPVVLDRARRQVLVDGQVVPMPRKEFDIAEMLMCHVGSVVTRSQLVRELWGSARDTKTLDVQVGRLRARLASAEGRQRILTIRGLGYRFASDEDLDVRAPQDPVPEMPEPADR